jgi:hypothetical protein
MCVPHVQQPVFPEEEWEDDDLDNGDENNDGDGEWGGEYGETDAAFDPEGDLNMDADYIDSAPSKKLRATTAALARKPKKQLSRAQLKQLEQKMASGDLEVRARLSLQPLLRRNLRTLLACKCPLNISPPPPPPPPPLPPHFLCPSSLLPCSLTTCSHAAAHARQPLHAHSYSHRNTRTATHPQPSAQKLQHTHRYTSTSLRSHTATRALQRTHNHPLTHRNTRTATRPHPSGCDCG